ncbi:hypothetical protein OHB26_38855 (plasmid) [Nocardia sp. NBC_01503]|uniref:hypothetical protein n=1 Tax=Nocardia sp. NBC_01503 TaxID=2975997 RepID=UPI002E7B29AE|nr:hypothetical protein [Nocardia sp. NBC_01503]WTL36639.1 hypothetical protein OHB26_38855 [Nocardia sp. NBC_01503]
MTDQTSETLTLSARLHRLFAAFHLRDTSAQSTDSVADSVTATLGKTVSATDIDRMRAGDFDGSAVVDTGLLEAIAHHFGVPPAYLTDPDGERVAAIDTNLRLIAAARDAGVSGLALRGDSVDLSELAEIFTKMAQRRKPPAGQGLTS